MTGRKKNFPCGHKGFGRYCHCCAEEQKSAAKKAKLARAGISRKPESDLVPEDMREYRAEIVKLPTASLRDRAIKAIQGLVVGKGSYREFWGKRLEYDRRIISIPIGRNWHMVLEEQQDKSKKLAGVFSHEEYNVRKPG